MSLEWQMTIIIGVQYQTIRKLGQADWFHSQGIFCEQTYQSKSHLNRRGKVESFRNFKFIPTEMLQLGTISYTSLAQLKIGLKISFYKLCSAKEWLWVSFDWCIDQMIWLRIFFITRGLEGCWWFLTEDLEEKVILGALDDVVLL